MEYEIFQYAFGIWSTTQKNWSRLKKELRAICLGIAKFKDFVIYKNFTVKTDCQALNFSIHKCDFEDAKYMLVSCSAFINYLIQKANKIGVI